MTKISPQNLLRLSHGPCTLAKTGRKSTGWLALAVGNEEINLYIGILGMKLPETSLRVGPASWEVFLHMFFFFIPLTFRTQFGSG